VEVFGHSPVTDGARIRAATGFLPEAMTFPFDHMKVREILAMLARFRPSWDSAYAERLSRELNLRMNTKWKQLSKGETRRTQLVATLAHRPPLLLLDEPTDGLDPVVRETVLGILAEHIAETDTTVLFSSHVLHEAQGLADRLLVLKGGRVRLHADVETLRRTLFRVELRSAAATAPPSAMLIREEARAGGIGSSAGSGSATGSATDAATERARRWVMRGSADEIRDWAAGAGAEIHQMRPLTLSEAALAYLSPGTPARGLPAVHDEVRHEVHEGTTEGVPS
jgi:ABC-2 type transport system ATP-binding protein